MFLVPLRCFITVEKDANRFHWPTCDFSDCFELFRHYKSLRVEKVADYFVVLEIIS